MVSSREHPIIKMLYRLGEFSFGIYLIHAIFLDPVSSMLGLIDIGPNNPTFYFIVFTFTLAFSYAFVYIVDKLPLSDLVIGSRKKSPRSNPKTSSTKKLRSDQTSR